MKYSNMRKFAELSREHEKTLKVMPYYSGSLQYDQYTHKCNVLLEIASIYIYKASLEGIIVKAEKPKTKYKLHQYITVIEKEVAMRAKLYPRWIREGSITSTEADIYQDIMNQILDDLKTKQPQIVQNKLFQKKVGIQQ